MTDQEEISIKTLLRSTIEHQKETNERLAKHDDELFTIANRNARDIKGITKGIESEFRAINVRINFLYAALLAVAITLTGTIAGCIASFIAK